MDIIVWIKCKDNYNYGMYKLTRRDENRFVWHYIEPGDRGTIKPIGELMKNMLQISKNIYNSVEFCEGDLENLC